MIKPTKIPHFKFPVTLHFRREADTYESGGIALFIFNELDFTFLQYLNRKNSDIEILSIELLQDLCKNIY